MKILFLPAYFFPEQAASSYLSENRNQAFADAGFDMVVYTPMPTRGISNEEREKFKRRKLESMYGGQMIVHRFSLMREGKRSLARAFRYTLSCVKQFCLALFAYDARQCDVMFISSTPPIQGAMAALIKKIRHIPLVYNLQDIFPDSLVGTGMAKKGGMLWKIGRMIEDFTYRNADKIIVISEDFKRNIMAKGVPEEKIEVIYNWVDEMAVIPVAKEDNHLYDELSLPKEKFYVVYAGNFGNAQNIDVIIRAAESLKNIDDIRFVLFGTGGMKSDYEKMVMDKQLNNVQFFPLQPYDKVSYVYSLGTVGIVTCKKGMGKGAMPSKTWSILSAGTAVIANYDCDTDLEKIIISNNIGLFTEADDADALSKAIFEMYSNPEMCAMFGRSARKFIEGHLTKKFGTK